jgi:hypothetical protein
MANRLNQKNPGLVCQIQAIGKQSTREPHLCCSAQLIEAGQLILLTLIP